MSGKEMMIPDTLESLAVPLADLEPYERNPRQGDVGAIATSLERNGQYRPIVVNSRDNVILAGNHTWYAARELGWEKLAATYVDADPEQARRIVLVDNRSNDLATYDNQALADLLREIVEVEGSDGLAGTGYDSDDLDALLADAERERGLAGDPNAVPEAPTVPVTQPGDLWLLGEHRLLCGDATDIDSWGRVLNGAKPVVIYTDPPYGLGIGTAGKIGKGKQHQQFEDDSTEVAAAAYALVQRQYPDVLQVWWGANHYGSAVGNSSCWLVWDKETQALTFADAELAWTNHPSSVKVLRHRWHGIKASEQDEARVHSTQKPVALTEWALEKLDPPSGSVLDLFGGSGSTLLAAHRRGRIAHLVELDPTYCDVICRRFQEYTGTQPVREADGKSHDFTETQ